MWLGNNQFSFDLFKCITQQIIGICQPIIGSSYRKESREEGSISGGHTLKSAFVIKLKCSCNYLSIKNTAELSIGIPCSSKQDKFLPINPPIFIFTDQDIKTIFKSGE